MKPSPHTACMCVSPYNPPIAEPRSLTSKQVSAKYLELTKKKLELTRLPRELELPDERIWEQGTPKSVLEPLLDFWYVSSFFYTRPSQILIFKQARRLRLAGRRIALQLDSPSIPHNHHHTLCYLSWNHTIPTHTLRTQAI